MGSTTSRSVGKLARVRLGAEAKSMSAGRIANGPRATAHLPYVGQPTCLPGMVGMVACFHVAAQHPTTYTNSTYL